MKLIKLKVIWSRVFWQILMWIVGFGTFYMLILYFCQEEQVTIPSKTITIASLAAGFVWSTIGLFITRKDEIKENKIKLHHTISNYLKNK